MSPHKRYRVISAYDSAYPDPLTVQAGEMLRVVPEKKDAPGWLWCIDAGGKGGWVPRTYVSIDGDTCRLLCHYNATELSVKAGEVLKVEKEESGWVWAVKEDGQRGWVPKENIEIL